MRPSLLLIASLTLNLAAVAAGDRTDDVLARLDAVAALRPRVVALLVGVNDRLAGRDATVTADGIDRVVAELGRRLPDATIVVQGLLPVDRQHPAHFQEADAENLPFADGTFDVVMSTFGVMFTPDQEKAASELARVCRPGGRVGLANL